MGKVEVGVEEKGGADGREDYTEDGTVDLKGRPILRSKTGRWRACSFIVGKYIYIFACASLNFMKPCLNSLMSFRFSLYIESNSIYIYKQGN